MIAVLGIALLFAAAINAQSCPDYATYSTQIHPPLSLGRYQLSYQRPDVECRTFISPEVEQVISQVNQSIYDPDLQQLFVNTYPNTLDTAIKWTGYAANNSQEELAFVITGDMQV